MTSSVRGGFSKADPGPIAKMFWLEEGLMSALQLDGIITVLDSEHILKSLEPKKSVAKIQIAMSDSIVLNKMDKCGNKEEIISKIKAINTIAPITYTTFGQLDSVDQILNLHAYNTDTSFSFVESKTHAHDSEGECEDEDCKDSQHLHTSGMATLTFEFQILKTEQQYQKLIKVLQKLHWKNFGLEEYDFGDIHRTKGLIITEINNNEEPKFSVLQGVRDTFEMLPGAPITGVNQCKLVLIGENLKRSEIQQLLDSIV